MAVNLFKVSDFVVGAITIQGVDNEDSGYYKNASILRLPTYSPTIICNYNFFIAYYDSDYNFIERDNYDAYYVATIPSTARYYRLMFVKAVFDLHSSQIICTLGDTIPDEADFTPDIPDSSTTPLKQPYIPTGKFKFWAQKVLPTVYDDSLSYYEVLTKLVRFLNDVIDNVDALNESVDNTNSAFVDLQTYVNTTKDELITTYNELQDFVNDYFDSLDVQSEINYKLDQMAEGGELTNLIAPIIPSYVTGWLTENVDPVGSAVVVDASLSIEGAAADAERTGRVKRTVRELETSVYDVMNYTPGNLIKSNDFVEGTITLSGEESANSNYYRNNSYLRLPDGAETLICNYNWLICYYDKDYNFISRDNVNGNQTSSVPSTAEFYRMIFAKNVFDAHSSNLMCVEGSSIPPSYVAYSEHFNMPIEVRIAYGDKSDNLFIVDDFEYGAISGSGSPSETTAYMRNIHFHVLDKYNTVFSNYNYFICFYDVNQNFISRVQQDANNSVNIPVNAYYYKLLFATNVYKYHKNNISVRYTRAEKEHNCNIKGKHFWIYKFGGNGNDWCFVHTPSTYDPTRKQPYPFVICNHGNNTNMDGSPEQACWTARTMYMPVGEADASLDQIETSDSSLWYSNPTIEALLEAGYVVCGCQNYSDSLYGNEECRDACVDFYNHMVNNYNVNAQACFMIGASNGALTSINAAYYLGGKVRAMIFQYPLTCLVNQYFAHPEHQSSIRAAYGIAISDPTEAQLIEATKTHDVLHTNIVNGIRTDMFPAVKFYYSLTDTVTPAIANSIPMYNMLINSTKIAEYVQVDSDGVTREHGNIKHFDPTGFVNFFNKFI